MYSYITLATRNMLRTLATIVICWKAAEAGFYPPDCPVHCECNGPATMCEGTFIPELDQRITRYTIKNVTPSMKTLTTNITYKLDHLVSLNLISVGLEDFEKGALGIISNLETLKITQNSIRTLSAEDFEGCNVLAFLNLENNNIQRQSATSTSAAARMQEGSRATASQLTKLGRGANYHKMTLFL
ncbi:hypothetical protein SK128_005609 [Halocaridina rubra]|uniref:LRRNT domain-containing protein n=1 Tax=Halocaridina rubra TaxID=373956 RepID=A0AAN9A0S3_HALRR